MKALLCAVALLFLTSISFAQNVYQIRADTVRIYNTCDTAELVLENRTKDTLGFLFNKGKGRTEFRRLHLQQIGTKLAIAGQDTLDLSGFNLETLQTVMNRGNTTTRDIVLGGTPSPALLWGYNTDYWRIFVESPQDTPAGDMIFETGDNDQEGWMFRSKNGTTPKQVLNIQPEGTFTFMGNNILHAGNHAAGSAFSQTLTGANVFSTITTNASGHLTQLTTRALTPADIGAAPASTSGNYIQNLSSGTQTANFSINGTGSAAYFTSTNGTGSNVPHLRLQTGGLNRWVFSMEGTESTGNAGSDLSIGRYNDAGAQIESAFRLQRSTGNLGLGIAAPTEKLHVNGNIISQVTGAHSSVIARSTSTGDAILTTDVMGISSSSFRTFRTGGRTGIINNSTEAVSILIGGNVGIGTATPAAKLEVRDSSTVANTTEAILSRFIGDANFRLEVRKGIAANTIGGVTGKFGLTYNGTENSMINFHRGTGGTGGFMSFSTSDGTERMRIDAAGNVGIGTAAPLAKLTVSGTTTSEMFVMNTTAFGGNTGAFARFYNSGTPNNANLVLGGILMGTNPSAGVYRTAAQIEARSDAAWTDGSSHPSNLIFYTVPSGLTTVTERMRIDPDGNVGIGTNNPTAKLEVGNVTGAELQFSGANTANILQAASAQPLYINSTTGPMYLGANGSASQHITILSNGNVGLSDTSPSQRLEASGNIRANGGNVQCGPTDASLMTALTYTTRLGVVGTFSNTPFAVYTNSTERVRVDSLGNVGIGTSAPTSKLHVAGAGLFTGQVQATSFYQSSLRSLKKDIQPFTASALDIFKKVQVRTFKFKADTTGKTNIGFIADEVPNEMATPQRNGVDQANTVALLVKAVQELTEQNKVLQQKISELETKMKEK